MRMKVFHCIKIRPLNKTGRPQSFAYRGMERESRGGLKICCVGLKAKEVNDDAGEGEDGGGWGCVQILQAEF